jgi:uncharacterized membrane protein YoaK (UPF0700 family)
VVKDGTHHQRLLLLITSILISSAVITNFLRLKSGSSDLGWVDVVVILGLVIAMATQNVIHHFIPGPMTTIMTGTVMNTTASLTEKYILGCTNNKSIPDSAPVNSQWRIYSFGAGCLISAFITMQIGLGSIIVPSITMLFVLAFERN